MGQLTRFLFAQGNDELVDWYLTKDGDKSCLELYERHYSAYKYKDGRPRYQFVGPGFNIVLRTARADAFFVWRKFIDDSGQTGINCAAFRNEGLLSSSKLIRQADAIADCAWPGERHYTYVNPEAVRSSYPGWCFIRARWRKCGMTKSGLTIMERKPKAYVGDEKRLEQLAAKSHERKITPEGLITASLTWEDHLEVEAILDRRARAKADARAC